MWNRLKYTNFTCEVFDESDEGALHIREDHKYIYIVVDDSFVRVLRGDVSTLIKILGNVVRK